MLSAGLGFTALGLASLGLPPLGLSALAFMALGLIAGVLVGCVGIGGVIIVPVLAYIGGVPFQTAIPAASAAYIISGIIGTLAYAFADLCLGERRGLYLSRRCRRPSLEL